MQIYEPSDSYLTDSTEYKLLNMVGHFLQPDREKLSVGYRRGGEEVQSEVSFREMDEACAGLSKTAILLSREYPDSTQFTRHLNATCAHLFGSCIDLNSIDGNTRAFTYMSHLSEVKLCNDDGVFLLAGLCYRVTQQNIYGIPMVECGPFGTATLKDADLEKLWPGCTSLIPLMNTLDYSNAEMVRALCRSGNNQVSDVYVELPTYD